jgi:acetyltransferase-like isoleucine patch superfamily enzyme
MPPAFQLPRIFVGCNFTCRGDTEIGHDAVIRAGVWLTRSVTPNATVVMETPRLKMRSDADAAIDSKASFQI